MVIDIIRVTTFEGNDWNEGRNGASVFASNVLYLDADLELDIHWGL